MAAGIGSSISGLLVAKRQQYEKNDKFHFLLCIPSAGVL